MNNTYNTSLNTDASRRLAQRCTAQQTMAQMKGASEWRI
jgi:hypothetical protein